MSIDAKTRLEHWLQDARKLKSVGGAFEIDVPNPAVGEHTPGVAFGEREDCLSINKGIDLGPDYYDLKVTSTPSGALVYVDGKYIGHTGVSLKARNSTVNVLVRKPGFEDVAKRVSLIDGLNELSIQLKGAQ